MNPSWNNMNEDEREWLRQEILADAEEDRRQDCILSGTCCCPQEEPSLYSPGGPIEYDPRCPEHGEDEDD